MVYGHRCKQGYWKYLKEFCKRKDVLFIFHQPWSPASSCTDAAGMLMNPSAGMSSFGWFVDEITVS